jgi:hypothetical protein
MIKYFVICSLLNITFFNFSFSTIVPTKFTYKNIKLVKYPLLNSSNSRWDDGSEPDIKFRLFYKKPAEFANIEEVELVKLPQKYQDIQSYSLPINLKLDYSLNLPVSTSLFFKIIDADAFSDDVMLELDISPTNFISEKKISSAYFKDNNYYPRLFTYNQKGYTLEFELDWVFEDIKFIRYGDEEIASKFFEINEVPFVENYCREYSFGYSEGESTIEIKKLNEKFVIIRKWSVFNNKTGNFDNKVKNYPITIENSKVKGQGIEGTFMIYNDDKNKIKGLYFSKFPINDYINEFGN